MIYLLGCLLLQESFRFIDNAMQVMQSLGKCINNFQDQEQFKVSYAEFCNLQCPYQSNDTNMTKDIHYRVSQVSDPVICCLFSKHCVFTVVCMVFDNLCNTGILSFAGSPGSIEPATQLDWSQPQLTHWKLGLVLFSLLFNSRTFYTHFVPASIFLLTW